MFEVMLGGGTGKEKVEPGLQGEYKVLSSSDGITNRSLPSLVSHNGQLYQFGGLNGIRYDTLHRYNFNDKTWTKLSTGPSGRYGHGAVVLNDKLYIFGGDVEGSPVSATVWEYSFDTNLWLQKTSIPKNVRIVSAAGYGDYIYLVGGMPKPSSGQVLTRYNVLTGVTDYKANPSYNLYGQGIVAHEGKIYALGGYSDATGYLKNMEVYDIASNTWETLAPTPYYFVYSKPIIIDGDIYVMTYAKVDTSKNLLLKYDILENVWTELPITAIAGRWNDGGFCGIDSTAYYIGAGALVEVN